MVIFIDIVRDSRVTSQWETMGTIKSWVNLNTSRQHDVYIWLRLCQRNAGNKKICIETYFRYISIHRLGGDL